MKCIDRSKIEGHLFDLSFTENISQFHRVFINGWDYVLVDPDYLLDESNQFAGLQVLGQLDKSEQSDLLYFYLTTFGDMEDMPAFWTEKYSVSSLIASEKDQWQLAFSGMYFFPTKQDWCGIYLDVPCQDVVILGGDSSLISKVKKEFDPNSLLTEEMIEALLEKRYGSIIFSDV